MGGPEPDRARGVCGVAQQFRNLSIVHEDLPRHLIHDRDTKFTAHADELLRAMGTQPVLLPPRSPDLNGHAERWIRTARSECLDHVIILNEGHLRWAIREFVRYYKARRPHRSLGLGPPEGPVDASLEGRVGRRKVLGGLINDYHRRVA